MEWAGRVHICEAKGTNKAIRLRDHLRQLIDYLQYFEGPQNERPKGIFFGNPYMEKELELRDETGAPEFPDTVVQRAIQLDISLVLTRLLFDAYCKFLAGELEAKAILDAITQASGPADWPKPKQTLAVAGT